MTPRKLILKNQQCLGDIVMLTAAVRDLHENYPGQFLTDVQTSCPEIWNDNPYISTLHSKDVDVESIYCHYPLIHRSNTSPFHFIHGFIDYLSKHLGQRIYPTRFSGDIYLSAIEREKPPFPDERLTMEPYWLIVSGGKSDFTIKWWDFRRYQEVVNHFKGRINFVQVGELAHYHPALEGVLDLRGRTNIRELVSLVFHSHGIVCPVTALMHLAAAVPLRPNMNALRPCVVIAGGREPSQWEAYPNHQFIHTIGALQCCSKGGCWRSRTFPLGDGSDNDLPANICSEVIETRDSAEEYRLLRELNLMQTPPPTSHLLPKCMNMITAADVIRRVELYLEGAQGASIP